MKGLARHPVPVMILARLAVDKAHQRKGLGQALLKDALLRTAQAADIAGIAACWYIPRTIRRGGGTNPGNLSPVRPIRIICSLC
jgi:GNAT superfamily N-acetyltransferase